MFTFTSLPTHVEHVTCTRHNFYCPTIPIYPNNTMFYIFVVGTKTAGGVLIDSPILIEANVNTWRNIFPHTRLTTRMSQSLPSGYTWWYQEKAPSPPYVTYVYLLLRCSTPLYVYTSAPYGLNIDILQHTHVHSTDYSNWYGVSVDLISHTCILPTSSTISTLSRYSLSGHFHHNETHFSRGRRRDKVALGILNSFIFLGHLRPDTFHVPNNFQ